MAQTATATDFAIPQNQITNAQAAQRAQKRITVRSHTKAIYLYPTFLSAMACLFLAPADGAGAWGNVFISIFFMNLLVVMFEFSSLKTLIVSLVGMLMALGVWSFGLVPVVSDWFSGLHFTMNSQGYGLFAVFFGTLIVGDFIWAHLNRWEFAANDVKHIQLFSGHAAHYPGRGLRFQVKTEDVWERLLLGCGSLLLGVGRRKIRIQNVPFVRKKVAELEKFIRTAGVFSDDEDVFDGDDDDFIDG